MPKLSYETADTVIYDPVAVHRTATRGLLYTLGFRNIQTFGTLEAMSQSIKRVPPDLVLAEAQGVETELCAMIQTLRQGAEGHANPFLVIVVTAWEKSRDLVHMVVNSGADDLVLRPFSTALVKTRIDSLVERRKQFVITHDYVGPDRRSDPTRVNNTELFQPPNTLKLKAAEGLPPSAVQARVTRELRAAKETLAKEKLRRDTYQICILWRLLQDCEDPAMPSYLAKLREIAKSVTKRCRDAEIETALQWCESIQVAAEGLHFGVDRNASMHLLGQGALNLNQLMQPDQSRADHLRSLDDTVAMIRARVHPAADPLPEKEAG